MTGSSAVLLRPARPGDLDWARDLVAALGLPADGIEDQFGGGGYVVAERDGERVGVGGIEVYGGFGLLRSVAVTRATQGRDIGRAIVTDRIAWCRTRGLSAVYLLTETAPGFFERLGFARVERSSFPRDVQRSKEFSEVCPESAVAMVLAL